ncbi:DUF1794 domain-containing protein [Allofranklinella schreckenbergeri]|uniref:DUF1794 domain-containing protein n=1 Tax=Allofranklinella schreckenbergeri TaxID=1076744 RepID=A0A3M6Q8U1_9BURK|nr:heme-binding beta-barrel domain-containing protein [Allofranklinella schreckenbergeri]RMW99356.1 DUF1794 domain-containing protein [Allofranklinella schreckenbergeri]
MSQNHDTPTRPAASPTPATAPSAFPADIYTEPRGDVDTLANLGPLARMAGVWQGTRGVDVKPKAQGPKTQDYVERIELQPIDAQTNGPQLFYGLRYHTHITKPDQVKTYHDQTGHWLWEPATHTVIHTLSIPRGMVVMAGGIVAPDADEFELVARLGDPVFGICSNPFLDHAFKTVEFRIKVGFNADGSWWYDEDTVMQILGQSELFHHTDRNHLTKIADATPNPLALAAQQGAQ